MSAATRRRLSPLLDKRAIATIANKLWDVRSRLSLHTHGNIPSPVELGFALYLHMQRSDAERLERSQNIAEEGPPDPTPPGYVPSDAPSVRLLSRLLAVSDATYFVCERPLLLATLARLNLPPPVAMQAQADKWAPGYVVVRDDHRGALLLSVRGSRDVGDLLTNLSSDAEPFLAGTAHQGIVRSARNLHAHLRPILAQQFVKSSSASKLRHGLIILGHSLGGAVAAALTMLLRYSRPPRTESPIVTDVLTSARCYSFASPPFLCKKLAKRTRRLPIVSVAYGLDVVPRLSPASIDRLLAKLSAYDFSPHVSSAVSNLVRSVTTPVFGEREAEGLASRVAGVSVDARVLAGVSGGLAEAAKRALNARSNPSEGTRAPSSMWNSAITAVLFATQALGSGVQANARRFAARRETSEDPQQSFAPLSRRHSSSSTHNNPTRSSTRRGISHDDLPRRVSNEERPSSRMSNLARSSRSFHHLPRSTTTGNLSSRALHDNVDLPRNHSSALPPRNPRRMGRHHRGMSTDDMDRYLDSLPGDRRDDHSADIPEMYLAGELWHIDRPFVVPTANAPAGSWPVPKLVRRQPDFFRDIEVSAWMIYDHDYRVIGKDLNRMLR